MKFFERRGEAAYAAMYDAANGTAAAAQYSNAKDDFASAIGAARRAGRPDDIERLTRRIADIKAVYRGQFST